MWIRGWTFLLVAAALVIGGAWYGLTGTRPEFALESEVISPKLTANGEATIDGKLMVETRWRLRNVGRRPLEGLALATSCQCQIHQRPPEILQPGESAEIAVSVTPPNAGRVERTIPVLRNGSAEPVTELRIKLNVPVTPPSWIARPNLIELRSIAQRSEERRFVFEAIEQRAGDRWIRNISTDDATVVKATLVVEESPWGEDGKLCLRKYSVDLQPTKDQVGQYRSTLLFRESDTSREQYVPITLEVLSPTVVLPSELRFAGDTNQQKVTLVRRLTEVGEIKPSFDEKLIDVNVVPNTQSTSLVFEVKPRTVVSEPIETEVLFEAADFAPARLLVRLVP